MLSQTHSMLIHTMDQFYTYYLIRSSPSPTQIFLFLTLQSPPKLKSLRLCPDQG